MSSPAFFKFPWLICARNTALFGEEVRPAIDEVNDTQQFILGPAVQNFEDHMANYLHCRYSIGVASGSDALLLALPR